MSNRNRITAGLAAVTVAFALGACDDNSPSSPSTPELQSQNYSPQSQNDSRQIGLVNVSTGDVALLNNVNLAVAANVLATACGFTIPIAVLSTQIIADGSVTECETTVEDGITITQAVPGEDEGSGSAGGNTSRQAGLVNVSLGDVDILNNVNAAIAANVLVTACEFTVPLAILAIQAVADAGETGCTTEAGEIVIDQSQA